MKKCLWCDKEFESKKDTAKFCSTSHRVMYNRKHGKRDQVTPLQLQVLYNSLLTAINQINTQNGQPPALTSVIVPEIAKAADITFNEAMDGITAATSSYQIKTIWERILKKTDWPTWQMNRLTQLKDNQLTKIDF